MQRPDARSLHRPLDRLLHPASIAVIGGDDAAEVVRQCRRSGYAGTLWAVNPRRDALAGLPCFASVADLPAAPDAAFVAVPRDQALAVVSALSQHIKATLKAMTIQRNFMINSC